MPTQRRTKRSIRQVSELLRQKKISPVELVAACLDRIKYPIMLDVLAEQTNPRGSTKYSGAFTQQGKIVLGIAQNVKTDTEVSRAFEEAIETTRSLGYPTRAVTIPLIDFGRGVANIEADRNAIVDRAFKDVDVLLLPTVPTTTPLIENASRSPQALSAEATLFANYYGLPAISVPCDFDRQGLPLGLQIVGKPYDDCAVLRLADQYGQAAGYGKKHPIA
jgi:aspartyl-tRNA(Asn)/glutamyl-tRNA(Gln) amidotransferase subunit A